MQVLPLNNLYFYWGLLLWGWMRPHYTCCILFLPCPPFLPTYYYTRDLQEGSLYIPLPPYKFSTVVDMFSIILGGDGGGGDWLPVTYPAFPATVLLLPCPACLRACPFTWGTACLYFLPACVLQTSLLVLFLLGRRKKYSHTCRLLYTCLPPALFFFFLCLHCVHAGHCYPAFFCYFKTLRFTGGQDAATSPMPRSLLYLSPLPSGTVLCYTHYSSHLLPCGCYATLPCALTRGGVIVIPSLLTMPAYLPFMPHYCHIPPPVPLPCITTCVRRMPTYHTHHFG